MTKSCTKVRHSTHTEALLLIMRANDPDVLERRPKAEQHAYRCSACGGWHLTSGSPTEMKAAI
jgi:hypothetical protein